MTDSYKVIEVLLESIPYKIMIYQIPEHELNDKLTFFTRDRGIIKESYYQDFLIATCVSEISKLLQYLRDSQKDIQKLGEVRQEVLEKIMELNPKLMPSNLIINSNFVVKVKGADKQAGEIPLAANDHWRSMDVKPTQGVDRLDVSKIQYLRDLPCIKVQKFWRRLNRYITVKQYEPGSELVILANHTFSTRSSFEQYVVLTCVEEVEDLFNQLDRLQLPSRVSPHILMHELYELCRGSNPFLDYEVYKDNNQIEEQPEASEDEEAVDPFKDVRTASHSTAAEETLSEALNKKKLKTFRDVPKNTLLGLGSTIKKRVIGQADAIDDLVDAIQRASVGLKSPEQPIGAFIFTGFTGVGKTYTAKILADELTTNKNSLITVDCSEYSADHEYAKLIGAPHGYIGHEHGGYLTNALLKNPFSVVLFDEIEKASDKVHQLLLQIMDEARLTDGKGRKVSFRDAIIIMTSNLGVQEMQSVEKTIGFGDVAVLTKDRRVTSVKEALKKKFRPEFLNRLTGVVHFDALTKADYHKIIKLELEKLKRNLKVNRTPYSKLDVSFDKSLYGYIYKVGIDEKFGARPLQRAIEREVSTPLARKILKEDINCDTASIVVSAKKGQVIIDVQYAPKTVDEPPFFMATAVEESSAQDEQSC
jgi:ATP-dependent Clp protease ATP-binding subunit ClpA